MSIDRLDLYLHTIFAFFVLSMLLWFHINTYHITVVHFSCNYTSSGHHSHTNSQIRLFSAPERDKGNARKLLHSFPKRNHLNAGRWTKQAAHTQRISSTRVDDELNGTKESNDGRLGQKRKCISPTRCGPLIIVYCKHKSTEMRFYTDLIIRCKQ